MKEYTILMAATDFLPVLFFAIAAMILQGDLYRKVGAGRFTLLACGTVDVTVAGLLKALYKLLYTLEVCDFPALSDLFMPLQSIGFLLAGLAMLSIAGKAHPKAAMAVAPPLFAGTYLFIGCMVAGLAGLLGGLCRLAAKVQQRSAIPFFLLALVCSLGMGYLSTKDFDKAVFNWIAQGVNIVGQGSLLIGVIVLHNSKLRDMEW